MPNDHTQPSSPFTTRGFIAAAIIIGVIVLAAVIVVVTSLTTPKPAAQPTATPSGPVADGSDKSICGLTGFETESSLTAAPKTKWELVGTVATPSDAKVGPGTLDSHGLRTCFAHTAEGALYASVNYIALGSDARTLPYLAQLVEPGRGRDTAKAAASPNATPSKARLQVAGFKVDSYSATEAVIDVAWTVTSSGSRLVSYPMVMHWVDGDWLVSLTDAGQPPFSSSPLASLGGYIPWAGI